jgi:hypothetical protein
MIVAINSADKISALQSVVRMLLQVELKNPQLFVMLRAWWMGLA